MFNMQGSFFIHQRYKPSRRIFLEGFLTFFSLLALRSVNFFLKKTLFSASKREVIFYKK